MNRAKTADQAAGEAALLAGEAASNGTFGVGAILVENRTGVVLDRVSNAVVGTSQTGRLLTRDPTAHGEMQLIARYFGALAEGRGLPDPAELTIITSLEPCAMCAGAIMSSGFNVGIVAIDSAAGIGASGAAHFAGLPASIQDSAKNLFAYYEIEGERQFTGSPTVAYTDSKVRRTISPDTHRACIGPFEDSLERTMAIVNETGINSAEGNPGGLSKDDPLRNLIESQLPHALKLASVSLDNRDLAIAGFLKDLYLSTPGSFGAAALVDRHGNLLAASAGQASDPTSTGLIDVIRSYSRFRFSLLSMPEFGGRAIDLLPHPKYARLFQFPFPDPTSPLTLMELGAYGSTMEGPIPEGNYPNTYFFDGSSDAPIGNLRSLMANLPPFYSEVFGVNSC